VLAARKERRPGVHPETSKGNLGSALFRVLLVRCAAGDLPSVGEQQPGGIPAHRGGLLPVQGRVNRRVIRDSIIIEHLRDVPRGARTRCGVVIKDSPKGVQDNTQHITQNTQHTASSK
jgi:hypothetical protein